MGQANHEPAIINLTHEDLEKLPKSWRKATGVTPRETASGKWVMVGEVSERDAKLMYRTIRALHHMTSRERRNLTEAQIEGLLSVLLKGEERAQVDEDLILDNARLRASYLRRVPCYSPREVRKLSGLTPKNKSEPASRWKREGRVFAIRYDGADFFPAFQFEDGEPLPIIKKVLKALPGDLTPWQVAFWFASGNAWLDGLAPEEALSDGEALVSAASKMVEPAIG